jgi:luciferase family oxidoreductase group 1
LARDWDTEPLYILGSSLFGAQLAAMLGLPYAFASHFAPAALDDALAIYRERFEPSAVLAEPYAMCAYNVFAADSEEEAELLASSMQQSFVALRAGNPGPLPPPVPSYRDSLPPQARQMLDGVLSATAIGTRDQVGEKMRAFVKRTNADELILTSSIFDHDARKRSLTIAADAFTSEEMMAA